MNVGKMRHRIEIQTYSSMKNEVGEVIRVWVKYKTLWAEKKQLRGFTTTTIGKEGIEYAYRFKVRYRTDLDENMRIVYKGTVYEIKHINPIQEINLYETHIDCVHRREGVYNE